MDELVEVRAVTIPPQTCWVIESPLEDEENENSCILSHYEVGLFGKDVAMRMCNEIVMQYIQEPFFDELRTK